MNYLQDGDSLLIDLPYPVFASQEDTKCFSITGNLLDFLPCKVSTNLSQINLTLKLPIGFRALQAEADFDELLDEDDQPRQL
jgi:hypothetical protein